MEIKPTKNLPSSKKGNFPLLYTKSSSKSDSYLNKESKLSSRRNSGVENDFVTNSDIMMKRRKSMSSLFLESTSNTVFDSKNERKIKKLYEIFLYKNVESSTSFVENVLSEKDSSLSISVSSESSDSCSDSESSSSGESFSSNSSTSWTTNSSLDISSSSSDVFSSNNSSFTDSFLSDSSKYSESGRSKSFSEVSDQSFLSQFFCSDFDDDIETEEFFSPNLAKGNTIDASSTSTKDVPIAGIGDNAELETFINSIKWLDSFSEKYSYKDVDESTVNSLINFTAVTLKDLESASDELRDCLYNFTSSDFDEKALNFNDTDPYNINQLQLNRLCISDSQYTDEQTSSNIVNDDFGQAAYENHYVNASCSDEQLETKNRIIDGITHSINELAIIWCPQEQISSDCVATFVGKFGQVISIQNRYVEANRSSSLMVWGGIIVKYSSKQEVEEAVKGLPILSRYIKAVSLKKIIEHLAWAEASISEFQDQWTVVTVRSKTALPNKSSVINSFLAFGHVAIYPQEDSDDPLLLCTLLFLYCTQAYAMKYALETAQSFTQPLRLTIEVTEAKKELKILRKAKYYLLIDNEDYFVS